VFQNITHVPVTARQCSVHSHHRSPIVTNAVKMKISFTVFATPFLFSPPQISEDISLHLHTVLRGFMASINATLSMNFPFVYFHSVCHLFFLSSLVYSFSRLPFVTFFTVEQCCLWRTLLDTHLIHAVDGHSSFLHRV